MEPAMLPPDEEVPTFESLTFPEDFPEEGKEAIRQCLEAIGRVQGPETRRSLWAWVKEMIRRRSQGE